MGLLKFLNDLQSNLDVSKQLKDYVFDKRIFRTAIALTFLLFMFLIFRDGPQNIFKERIYVSCPADSQTTCLNPLFENYKYCGKSIPISETICSQEYLMQGFEYGTKKDWLQQNFTDIFVVILFSAFVFNHYVMNKNFRWSENFGKNKGGGGVEW